MCVMLKSSFFCEREGLVSVQRLMLLQEALPLVEKELLQGQAFDKPHLGG